MVSKATTEKAAAKTKAPAKKAATTKKTAAAKKKTTRKKTVTEEQIRQRAQGIYEGRLNDGTPGDANSDWVQAEKELL